MAALQLWIVDDDADDIGFLQEALLILGSRFTANYFTKGELVLSAIKDTSSLPDLIISDWQMPGINGLELAKMIRRDGRTRALPIALLSTGFSPADRAAAADLQIPLLEKPHSVSDFGTLIRHLVDTLPASSGLVAQMHELIPDVATQ